MASKIKQNPSFIGTDEQQIDLTFYPAHESGPDHKRVRNPVVQIRKTYLSIGVHPQDIPELIEALQQVHNQYLEHLGS